MYRGAIAMVAVLGVLVTAAAAADDALPIKGMRVPLSYYEDGGIKMQLTASRASSPEGSGEVEATGAVVESFDEAGSLTMRLQAATCRYDRVSGRIHSDSAVRMDRPDMEVTGIGMDWQPATQRVYLHSRVRVVLKGSRGMGNVLPERSQAVSVDAPVPSDMQTEGVE